MNYLFRSLIPVFLFLLCHSGISLDLSYSQIVSMAEKNSFALKHLPLLDKIENCYSMQSAVQFLPQIETGFTDNRSISIHAPDMHRKQCFIGLSMILFKGGQRLENRRLLLAERALKKQDFLQISESLHRRAIELFFRFLLIKREIEILTAGLAVTGKNCSIAEKELSLGQITETEFLNSLYTYKSLVLDQNTAEQQKEEILFEIKMLCGISSETEINITGSINPAYSGCTISFSAEECCSEALNGNSGLKTGRLLVRKNELAVKNIRKSFLPAVEADFKYTFSGDMYPLRDGSLSASFIFSFSDVIVPSRVHLSGGTSDTGAAERNLSFSAGGGNNISSIIAYRENFLEAGKSRFALSEDEEQVQFAVLQWFNKHYISKETLSLRRKQCTLQRKKRQIMEKKQSIGEIRSHDLLESIMDELSAEKSVIEAFCILIDTELFFSQLTGMPLRAYLIMEDIFNEE